MHIYPKEEKHIQGFAAEVAWVESGGNSKLQERLAVRPTSETIINDSYAKWIRSHQDLPLRLNQWCNVVRWEFKHPIPFLRSREFLWQEGHTAFATKEEAVKETYKILDFYEKVFTELAAVPVLKGMKSKTETFAGAEFSLSLEAFLPNGKAVQGCTSHHLGQNFAKAFNITFQDEKQQSQHVWQNSWGITTRLLGILIMIHSDDKGLVLPPKLALRQVVIVPILFDDSRARVLKEAQKVQSMLEKKGISVYLDLRDGYSPGWKFNEWEMKGVPVRIELGPKDLEKKEVMVVRRDTGEKQSLPLSALDREIALILEQMQQDLYAKAEKFLKQSIAKTEVIKDAEKVISSGKIVLVPWCGLEKCEEKWKEKTGAKSLNSPLEQPAMKKDQSCFACKEKARSWSYVGKSY
ncbi:proline--tRNA ligase [Candidatus Woesearchaeota archaeon]|nr:proline--tRNA ligase [Candidatus Woesearchaeota archaeon]